MRAMRAEATMPVSDPARQVRFGIKKRSRPQMRFGIKKVHLMVKRGCHETRALPLSDPIQGNTP